MIAIKPEQLIVVTYNIFLSLHKEQILRNIEKCVSQGVIVFCLQEVVHSGSTLIVDDILQRLGKKWSARCHIGDGDSLFDVGTCIIWDTKEITHEFIENITLPKLAKLGLHEVAFNRMFGYSGNSILRRSIIAGFTFNGQEVCIVSTHLDHVGGRKHRAKQFAYLLSKVQKYATRHHVICGDFNTFDLLGTGQEYAGLKGMLGNMYVDVTRNIKWTADIYKITLPHKEPLLLKVIKLFHIHIRRKLDYIWASGFEVEECVVEDLPGSDHLAVVAKLALG